MTKPTNLKYGAEISAKNKTKIQAAHDAMCEMGADCKQPEPEEADKEPAEDVGKSFNLETLVAFGSEVKSMGNGLVGGYLVRFSDAKTPDLTGDYFDAKTDFGGFDRTDVYYNHGLDKTMAQKKFNNQAEIGKDTVGVWVKHQLDLRDEYEKAVYDMTEAKKLGWSSGTASHIVERERVGKAFHIKQWTLGLDASYTPTPAEPRNSAIPLKSLFGTQSLAGRPASDGASVNVTEEEKKQAAILIARFL